MMSSNMSFSGEKSYDCGSLSPYGEVSTPDHHRVVQFSEIRCSTTRSSVDGRLRNNLLVQRLVQSFTSIENQLFVKIGSVLSLIFLTDLISLVLTTYFSFSADGLGILTLFIPSIITIHIHSSFYLFDYLLVCVNDIKQHIKNEIAAAAVLSTRMPATAARGGGGGGVGGGLLIPKEVRQNVNFSIRNESFFDESYSFQSFHIRSDQTETGISAKISYPIPPSNTDRQPIYIPPPI